MSRVKAKCPNCNELIDIDDSEFNVVCKYCGVPFMPKEGIEKYNEHIAALANNLNIDTINVNAEDISNFATLGLSSLKEKNHEKCGFYADDILKRKPSAPEGLLLKAFFVSNNYSKEEGIRKYFLAYENSKDEKLTKLILDTFKDEFEDYSIENFAYLFNEILHHNHKSIIDLYRYALTFVSSSFSDEPMITSLNLNMNDVFTYLSFKQNQSFIFDDYTFYYDQNMLVVVKEDKIYRVIYFKAINSETEKYFLKKEEKKYSYNFYVGERIVLLKSSDVIQDLEKLIADNGCTITPIKGGCYIATCIYGSYNAKEVWVLRRYRDEYLSSFALGRAFIKLYYLISPSIVKLFKNNKVFHRINKKVLDRKVKKLQDKGYLDTPYRDIK